ncbi:MAG TPA: hypothetical protein PKZ92_02255 [Candidatus Woesebacteria bacterium]|jgi:hypothetical protein|nr:hypothetical protein [Candidatus Shapirobacteria bacterium]HOR02057.1 hypothetical protein [Candidatus Woesebacteria bacterium]
MIKELILALIIGAILGLGVTGSYLNYKGKRNPPSDKPLITEPTLIPTISTAPAIEENQEETNNPLTIISPSDNSLVSSANLSISGTTTPDSQIVIATATTVFTGQSDTKGKFSLPIKLESGLNIIKISSIDPQNNQFDYQLNITYSTAKI